MAEVDQDLELMKLMVCELEHGVRVFEARGYRLDMITPADSPRVAEMSGEGGRVRLIAGAPVLGEDPDSAVPFENGFVLTEAPPAVVVGDAGRAGMRYRDLIPARHGGHVIASHVTIPGAGPVPDYVHHHDIDFQVIYVLAGRVKVVYEDQGEPFWMEAGDCVLQPPHIRHRVLESEGDCEVVEVASPAEHPTFVEHDIELPTDVIDAERGFAGQRFCFDQSSRAQWQTAEDGWAERVLGIGSASGGVGQVRVFRGDAAGTGELSDHHSGTLCLFFVLEGDCTLGADLEVGLHEIAEGDAVAIPRGTTWKLRPGQTQCSILQVTMA